ADICAYSDLRNADSASGSSPGHRTPRAWSGRPALSAPSAGARLPRFPTCHPVPTQTAKTVTHFTLFPAAIQRGLLGLVDHVFHFLALRRRLVPTDAFLLIHRGADGGALLDRTAREVGRIALERAAAEADWLVGLDRSLDLLAPPDGEEGDHDRRHARASTLEFGRLHLIGVLRDTARVEGIDDRIGCRLQRDRAGQWQRDAKNFQYPHLCSGYQI